ncbi:hypothetical protein [Paenibacillus sp. SN-8-1]|uniref:hypothetical protein n=1 Tax=Paenibacillus sp. SN-8-1 TaxID=3435409 RepID=UPI003D9A28D5
MNLEKLACKEGVTEGKLGTVGAKAIAYKLSERKLHRKHMLVSGFQQLMWFDKEIWRRAAAESPSIPRSFDRTRM